MDSDEEADWIDAAAEEDEAEAPLVVEGAVASTASPEVAMDGAGRSTKRTREKVRPDRRAD